jgi:ferredoxin
MCGNLSQVSMEQEEKMARVERRDQEPEKKEAGVAMSRREFLIGSGTGIAGLVIGGVVGREAFPKAAPAPEAVPAAAAPAAAPVAAPAASEPKTNHYLHFDPQQCTGCMLCAQACASHWTAYSHPEADVVNLEFSRIRPVRFQYVDVVSVCQDCKLEPWTEGSDRSPCEEVCPEEAIYHLPEGEGMAGYYGNGYKYVDSEKCLGALTNAGAAQKSARISSEWAFPSIPLKRKPNCAAAAVVTQNASRLAQSRLPCNLYP